MKLEGERLGSQESVSKCLQCEIMVNHAREVWGPFIAPQENLAVRVSETWPDMSGQPLWKLAWGPDMSSLRLSR
jgi:hypothetical protein